ncbi:hypothetical protein AARAC_000730, partial [Aspergillus arachidicola]
GQEEDILPGYRVKYTCDFYGQHNGGPVEGVESAKDCAQLCQTAGSGCTGSSWSMKERKLESDSFGEDEDDDPFGADKPEEDDPFGADEPEDKDTACGCDNCEVDVACEFSPLPNNENAADCYLGGYPDEASPALKGKAYKVFCQKLDDVGGKNIRPPFKLNSVKECIEACSDVPNSQCKRAIWTNSRESNGQRSCWLREWNGVKEVPTKVGSWSSAHVQE